jgi:hypothetical protein
LLIRLAHAGDDTIFEKMFSNEAYQEARDGIVRIEDPPGLLKDSTAKPVSARIYAI